MVFYAGTEASGLSILARQARQHPICGEMEGKEMSFEDDLKAEAKANRALERHAKAIARDCRLISKTGDGNCGYIFNRLRDVLQEAGLYSEPEPYKPNKKPIPNGLRKQVFERDAYRCVKCGAHHDLEADHVYPESLGGEATFENLQTLCKPCNMKKGNRVQA